MLALFIEYLAGGFEKLDCLIIMPEEMIGFGHIIVAAGRRDLPSVCGSKCIVGGLDDAQGSLGFTKMEIETSGANVIYAFGKA